MTVRWKSTEPNENQEIECAMDWVRVNEPWLTDYTIRIKNEEQCSQFVGKKLNAQGRLKGASDLMIAWPTSKYYGLFIEAKTKIGIESAPQKSFIVRMNEAGYYATFAYGAEEIIYFIKNYLVNKI